MSSGRMKLITLNRAAMFLLASLHYVCASPSLLAAPTLVYTIGVEVFKRLPR